MMLWMWRALPYLSGESTRRGEEDFARHRFWRGLWRDASRSHWKPVQLPVWPGRQVTSICCTLIYSQYKPNLSSQMSFFLRPNLVLCRERDHCRQHERNCSFIHWNDCFFRITPRQQASRSTRGKPGFYCESTSVIRSVIRLLYPVTRTHTCKKRFRIRYWPSLTGSVTCKDWLIGLVPRPCEYHPICKRSMPPCGNNIVVQLCKKN